MKFLSGLIVSISIFLLTLFCAAGLVLLSAPIRSWYDIYAKSFILKTCLLSLGLAFAIILIFHKLIIKELKESKKFYRINTIIYSIIALTGTCLIIIGDNMSGWDALGIWGLGMLLLIAAVGELVLSFIIHSLYVHVKQA